jgi:hypothetical protein
MLRSSREGVSELPFEFHQADLVKAEAAGEAVARCEL